MRRYPPSTINRYLDLPLTQRIKTHNTTPPSQTLAQAAHSLPPQHHGNQNTDTYPSPCSSRIGKAHTQSSHHQHLQPFPELHTPPTPLTRRISSTSPAIDKTSELHVPPIYALNATTPPPDPTAALRSPSHPHILAAYTCNTNNSRGRWG